MTTPSPFDLVEAAGALPDDEFYALLVQQCEQRGLVPDHTRDLIEEVIDSIVPDDDEDDVDRVTTRHDDVLDEVEHRPAALDALRAMHNATDTCVNGQPVDLDQLECARADARAALDDAGPDLRT